MNIRTGLKRGLVAGTIVSILVNGAFFTWWASSLYSWGIPLPGSELTLLVAVAAVLVAAVGGVLTPFRRIRATGLLLASAGLIVVISYFVALRAGIAVRMWGFERFAERATPVIEAIERYARQNGHPPSSLEQLVPGFLPYVPSTGVGSAPQFRYIVGDEKLYDGNPWSLELDVPIGILNWDMLVYYPLHNYPKYGYGGVLEPLADWAYVHE